MKSQTPDISASIPQKGGQKIAPNRSGFVAELQPLRKPEWIRVRLPRDGKVTRMKSLLRGNKLSTVCEEASCPNIHECFDEGTASFMILGDLCTRRCSFCDVAHGRPLPPDPREADNLAHTVNSLGLKYVVITSVDRDDLRDGGAREFASCIAAIRLISPQTKIEILVPDFRGKGKLERALETLKSEPPDVFNHNIETVVGLYRSVRPGADYRWSLNLLQRFKTENPGIPTKSGIMLGLGESREQIVETFSDLRRHQVDLITIGQYLQPGKHHHPVHKYWEPEAFEEFAAICREMGFAEVASGPLVRSSYHADLVAHQSGLL